MVFPLPVVSRLSGRDASFGRYWFGAVLSNAAADGKPPRPIGAAGAETGVF
jgi:hypothetical protein